MRVATSAPVALACALLAARASAQSPPAPSSAPPPAPVPSASPPPAPPAAPYAAPPAGYYPPPGYGYGYPPPGYGYAPAGYAAPGAYAPPPPVGPPPGAHRHDDFYLRMGLGAGRVRSSENLTLGSLSSDATIAAGGAAFELTIGGTLGHGVVLAGSLLSQQAPKANVEHTGAPSHDESRPLNLLALAAEWYPNPEGGFHVGGGLGAAGTKSTTMFFGGGAPSGAAKDPSGLGLALDAGYGFWIGDEWSMGGLVRLMWAPKLRSDESVDLADGTSASRIQSDESVAFSVTFSTTYN